MDATDRRALAQGIAERCGLIAKDVTAIDNGGSVNNVFRVRTPAGQDDAIIRFAIDARRKDETAVEEWALRAAARCGVPSPGVIARGRYRGVAFLAESFVRGKTPGADYGGDDLWHVLGSYARTISTVAVPVDAPSALFSRFGSNMEAAWRAHVDYNIAALTAGDPLQRLGVYEEAHCDGLRRALRALRDQQWNFGLCHRDLHPRNLILPPVGAPVLIDWGTAQAGPAPWLDAAQVLRTHVLHHVPDLDGLGAFLRGCGLPSSSRPDLESLVLLNALDLVRWALDQRPDRAVGLAAEARKQVVSLYGS